MRARISRRPAVRFLQASCEALPFADASFDLVAAFEVIEHLEHWQRTSDEARRVLKPAGVLLVSTPNKAYYAESRAEAGRIRFTATNSNTRNSKRRSTRCSRTSACGRRIMRRRSSSRR